MPLDLNDIQGLIHHEYGYPKTRHLLFEIATPAAGQALLAFLAPRVTHAALVLDPAPATLVNVGISHAGLVALNVDPAILARFPLEFMETPDPVTMGDVGPSAPEMWWNKQFSTSQVHLVIHLFGQSVAALDALTATIRSAAVGNHELLPAADGGAIQGGKIGTLRGETHFGYRDGISQPDVRWDDDAQAPGSIDYRHFLLGYPTKEIPSQPTPYAGVPASISATAFAKNGSYSVFRWLYQDVARFNRFLMDEGPRVFPGLAPADAQELLAAKLMGRWRNGTPLVKSPTAPDPDQGGANDFGYADDPVGLRCPVSAHIRVNNPRDQPLDGAAILMGGVPRIIRRGSPCGSRLEGTLDDGAERGLAGVFICASIQRQFYKLAAWMKENSFSPAFKDLRAQDPMANRNVPNASRDFAIPTAEGERRATLQDFVTTRGTAFFLLPSLTTLRQLAASPQ